MRAMSCGIFCSSSSRLSTDVISRPSSKSVITSSRMFGGAAGHRGQLFNHRGSEHIQEIVFVGLFFAPELLGLPLDLRTRADRGQNHRVGAGLFEAPAQQIAKERDAVDTDLVEADRGACHRQTLSLSRIHPRTPIRGVPVACPGGQFAGASGHPHLGFFKPGGKPSSRWYSAAHPPAPRSGVHFFHPPASWLVLRFELAAFDEEVEESRGVFRGGNARPLDRALPAPALRGREQRDARAFDRRRCPPARSSRREVGNQPDAARRCHLQVAAEPAGQIEHVDLVEVDAVLAEHHLQARRRSRPWPAPAR